ncbi:MAG: TolC family protein [Calditrichaeota bacterium]|nr:MAG: TolC family protein [Calditrichota bacterium]
MKYKFHINAARLGFTIAVISFFMISSFGMAQSLEKYLDQAAKNNPGLKAKYTEFEAALQRIPQVSSLPDPSLSFGYFVSPVETRIGPQKARFSLTQMFPWFGTLAAQKDAATLSAEAKYQAFLDAKNLLFFQVTAAWYPLYELNEMLRLQNENYEILTTYKQLATTAFSNAKGSMVDVIRVDIMIDNSATDIMLLKEKLRPLRTAFNKLLNRPEWSSIEVASALDISGMETGIDGDSLFAENPMLKSFDLKIKSAEAQEKAAFRHGLPKFGIGLSYILVDERPDLNIADNGKDAFMPMLSMTIPLFRKKYRAAVKEARLNQTRFTLNKSNLENNLLSAYDLANYKMEQAKQRHILYGEQISKTRQAIDLLHSAYGNSGKDFEEVLRMQQQLLRYEMSKATAVKEYYTAEAQRKYITGR